MNTITGQQAEALAAYIVTLRPGQRAWTKVSVLDALRAAATHISRDVTELTQAAMSAALDPTVATPQVIGMTGRHWERRSRANEPARAEPCRCGDTHMPTAPCREGQPATDPSTHIRAAKLQLGIPLKPEETP